MKGIKKLISLLVMVALTLAGSVVAFAELPAASGMYDVVIALTTDDLAITDSSNPEMHVAVATDWNTNNLTGKQLFVKADLSQFKGNDANKGIGLSFSGWGGTHRIKVYKVNADWDASTVTYCDMKDTIETLKAGSPDIDYTYTTEACVFEVTDLIDENGKLNFMLEFVDPWSEAPGSNYVYGPGAVGINVKVWRHENVSFEKETAGETLSLATDQLAMVYSETPDTHVTVATDWDSSNNHFLGRQILVKADLSDHKNLASATLSITAGSAEHRISAYKLDKDWDAATVTYNDLKAEIETLKAGIPDAVAENRDGSINKYRIDLAELVDENGMLNAMIEITKIEDWHSIYDCMYGPGAVGVKLFVNDFEATENMVDSAMRVRVHAENQAGTDLISNYYEGKTVRPFVALYDAEGALVKVLVGDAVAQGSEEAAFVNITAEQAVGASSMKVFMWQDGTLVPLDGNAEITK